MPNPSQPQRPALRLNNSKLAILALVVIIIVACIGFPLWLTRRPTPEQRLVQTALATAEKAAIDGDKATVMRLCSTRLLQYADGHQADDDGHYDWNAIKT